MLYVSRETSFFDSLEGLKSMFHVKHRFFLSFSRALVVFAPLLSPLSHSIGMFSLLYIAIHATFAMFHVKHCCLSLYSPFNHFHLRIADFSCFCIVFRRFSLFYLYFWSKNDILHHVSRETWHLGSVFPRFFFWRVLFYTHPPQLLIQTRFFSIQLSRTF